MQSALYMQWPVLGTLNPLLHAILANNLTKAVAVMILILSMKKPGHKQTTNS